MADFERFKKYVAELKFFVFAWSVMKVATGKSYIIFNIFRITTPYF